MSLKWWKIALQNIFIQFFFEFKNIQRKKQSCIFHDFSRFSMVFLSKLLRKTIENLEKSWKIMKNTTFIFSRKNFDHEKTFFCKTFFSISIQKVPRNPKIILRTPCDHFKDTKNIASKKKSLFVQIAMIIVPFYVALPLSITTLKSFTTVVGKPTPL